MCKRTIQQVCSTLTFLLGSLFGLSIAFFDKKEHYQNHVVILILLAVVGFHITQRSKGFWSKNKS
jgi:hypothetical protein